MIEDSERLLLISGPVGVGKTSVASVLSSLLQDSGVPHTFADLDALTYTYPRNASDPFNTVLALENISAVWNNCRKFGSRNLIISRVIESDEDAERISKAVAIPKPLICRLTASDQTLLKRVRSRDTGLNIAWQESRSIQLSKTMDKTRLEDFCITTEDRSPIEIAKDIRQMVTWFR